MLTQRIIQGLTFRIAKGEFSGHGQGVKRGDTITFLRFRIDVHEFKHLEVPLDLWSVLTVGDEIEAYTTLIGGKQILVAVGKGDQIKVSKKHKNPEQENIAPVLMVCFAGLIGGCIGMYSCSGSYGISAALGIFVSFLVTLISALAIFTSLWFETSSTNLQKAAGELTA